MRGERESEDKRRKNKEGMVGYREKDTREWKGRREDRRGRVEKGQTVLSYTPTSNVFEKQRLARERLVLGN